MPKTPREQAYRYIHHIERSTGVPMPESIRERIVFEHQRDMRPKPGANATHYATGGFAEPEGRRESAVHWVWWMLFGWFVTIVGFVLLSVLLCPLCD